MDLPNGHPAVLPRDWPGGRGDGAAAGRSGLSPTVGMQTFVYFFTDDAAQAASFSWIGNERD